MKITDKNKAKWLALYNAAESFRDFKPWDYFDDSFIFGIQDLETAEIGWCVIMGAAGEVFGLMVYKGDRGLEAYEDIVLSFGDDEDMSIALNQTGLKVEFVNRDEVDEVDLKSFKQMNLKYRGKYQYPNIRRIDPGLYPWPIDDSQVEFLTLCLTQSIHIIEKAIEGEIEMTDYDCGELLLLVPEKKSSKIEWKPTYIDFPEFDDVDKYVPNNFIVNRLKRELKRKDSILFISLQYIMKPIQDQKDQRPYFPLLGLWLEGDSGLILEFRTFSPDNFWNDFQSKLVEVLYKMECIPATIGVDSAIGMEVMDLYCEKLEIDLQYTVDHPVFQHVKDSMKDFY